MAVRDEGRGILRPLADDAPSQAIAEEAAGAIEISDAQTDVIDAACGGCGVLCQDISPLLTRSRLEKEEPLRFPHTFINAIFPIAATACDDRVSKYCRPFVAMFFASALAK